MNRGKNTHWILGTLITSTAMLTGCATFHEEHYFQETDTSGATTNYFRLLISGYSSFGRARYVAGYYDERAVDLFFNEVKRTGDQADDVKPIFSANLVDPGGTDKIKPLSPDAEHGAFMMILSSNPKAVTDVIGQFAESDQVAQAVTNLANKSEVSQMRRLSAQTTTQTTRLQSVATELRALFALVPQGSTPDKAATASAYTRILNSIAASLNSSQTFTSLDDPAVSVWLELQRTQERGE